MLVCNTDATTCAVAVQRRGWVSFVVVSGGSPWYGLQVKPYCPILPVEEIAVLIMADIYSAPD